MSTHFSLGVTVLILWTSVFIVKRSTPWYHQLDAVSGKIRVRKAVCAERRDRNLCWFHAQNKKSNVPLTHLKRFLKGQEGWISVGCHALRRSILIISLKPHEDVVYKKTINMFYTYFWVKIHLRWNSAILIKCYNASTQLHKSMFASQSSDCVCVDLID